MNLSILLSIASLFIIGCGNSLQSNRGHSRPVTASSFIGMDWDGKISGGAHDETNAITYDKNRKTITLSLPLTGSFIENPIDPSPVDTLPGSFLAVEQPLGGVTVIKLEIPTLLMVQNHPDLLNTATLPNEELIPGFKEGTHYYADLNVPGQSLELRVYISKGHLGVYLTSPFNPYVQLSYPINNSANQTLGYFSQVPAKGHHAGGFFLSFIAPPGAL